MIDTVALREKVLDLAIRGKLVPQDPSDEPASVLLERIRAQKQQMVKEGKLKAKDIKDDSIIFVGEDNLHYEKFADGTIECVEEALGYELPSGWTFTTIGAICTLQAGKFVSASEISPVCLDNMYPCYGGNGIRGYVEHYSLEGDFPIIGRQGALCGNVNMAHGKFYATEHAVVVTPMIDIDLNWLYHVLVGLNLNQYAGGAAQPGLAVSNVLKVKLPLPPVNEQKRIAEAINEALALVEQINEAKEDFNNIIVLIKSKILDLAIRGKLVPQNPEDEPASVLLERIRAEKEELIRQGKIKRDKKESVIFKGEDNSYYEKIGENTIDITDEIPFEPIISMDFVRYKSVLELVSGRDLLPNEYNDNGKGIPYITGASNFANGVINIARWTQSPQVVTHLGDLLITCKGTVGEMALNSFGEAHIARQVMAIRNNYHLNIDYVSLCIKYYIDEIKTAAKGLIPGISREDILDLIIPLPSEAYQSRVVAHVNELFLLVDSIKKSLA